MEEQGPFKINTDDEKETDESSESDKSSDAEEDKISSSQIESNSKSWHDRLGQAKPVK